MGEKSKQFLTRTRIFHCVESFVCLTSMLLQIIGFSTNAWMLQLQKTSGRMTKLGLWSSTICYNLDCKTKTHLDENKEMMSKGFSFRGIQYAFMVGHEVNTTLALVSVCLAFFLSVVLVFSKRGRRQMQIGLLILSLLSGVLLFTVVGYWTSELVASMAVKENQLKFTYYFPWSLLVSGMGALFISVNGIVMTVVVCCRKSTQYIVYETVKTKDTGPDSIPHQCPEDYDPPDYNDVDKDSDQSVV